MNIEEYYIQIEALANSIDESEKATHDYLEELINQKHQSILDIIDFRKTFVDSKEQDQFRGYLAIGFLLRCRFVKTSEFKR